MVAGTGGGCPFLREECVTVCIPPPGLQRRVFFKLQDMPSKVIITQASSIITSGTGGRFFILFTMAEHDDAMRLRLKKRSEADRSPGKCA